MASDLSCGRALGLARDINGIDEGRFGIGVLAMLILVEGQAPPRGG
jgi:hypothetical protein